MPKFKFEFHVEADLTEHPNVASMKDARREIENLIGIRPTWLEEKINA